MSTIAEKIARDAEARESIAIGAEEIRQAENQQRAAIAALFDIGDEVFCILSVRAQRPTKGKVAGILPGVVPMLKVALETRKAPIRPVCVDDCFLTYARAAGEAWARFDREKAEARSARASLRAFVADELAGEAFIAK